MRYVWIAIALVIGFLIGHKEACMFGPCWCNPLNWEWLKKREARRG